MRLSAAGIRARRLLFGGLFGAALVGIIGTVGCFWVGGLAAGKSAGLAAAAVLVFFGVGQGVQVLCADLSPVGVLITSLVSYLIRIAALALGLSVAVISADDWELNRLVIVGQMIASVVGCLAIEVWVYSRMHIAVFDPPTEGEGA